MIVLIPSKLKMAGFDYEIQFVKLDKELQSDFSYGQCSNMLRRIKIENELSNQERSKVFLHEVLEALNCVYLDNQLAHEQIQRLSYGLHQITEQLQLHFAQELKEGE